MNSRLSLPRPSRRSVLSGMAAASLAPLLDLRPAKASGADAFALEIDAPTIVTQGAATPVRVRLIGHPGQLRRVQSVQVFAPGNSRPKQMHFEWPHRGELSGTMKLDRSQNVIAIAELDNGRFLIGRRSVDVIG